MKFNTLDLCILQVCLMEELRRIIRMNDTITEEETADFHNFANHVSLPAVVYIKDMMKTGELNVNLAEVLTRNIMTVAEEIALRLQAADKMNEDTK